MKTIGILLGIALTALAVNPALAWFTPRPTSQTIRNLADVSNSIQVGAFTGGNTQTNGIGVTQARADDVFTMSHTNLQTGIATTNLDSRLLVNTDVGCGCTPRGSFTTSRQSNMATVNNQLMVQADSGTNVQQTGATVSQAHVDDITSLSHYQMNTGSATANTSSLTLVNVSWNGSL